MVRKKIRFVPVLVSFAYACNVTGYALAADYGTAIPNISKYLTDLDSFQIKIDKYIDGNMKKIVDEELDRQMADTKTEIEKYLSEVDEMVRDAETPGQAARIVAEAKKRVALKGIDSSVKKRGLEEYLGSFANGANEEALNGAVEALSDSLNENGKYRVIVKSTASPEKIRKTLSAFGNGVVIGDVIGGGGGNYVEILIPKNNLAGEEILDSIEGNRIPESLLGMEMLPPQLVRTTGTLDGESADVLWGMERLGADKYQATLAKAPKVKVAILDTGVDSAHPDIRPVFDASLSKDFSNSAGYGDGHGHGTHVSWTVGAAVNGKGVYGVNSNAAIVGIKVLKDDGNGSSYDIYNAIKYAADNGIKVINMSLGGDGNPNDDMLCQAIDYALGKGTISVVAAGNENENVSGKVPGGCKNALTVGAVDSNDQKADFSNYGTEVDVAAPGVEIYSSIPGNRYGSMNGTSMATPHVAGLVSVILAYKPNATLTDVKSLIEKNSVGVSGNIGRIVDMKGIMTELGVKQDGSAVPTPPEPSPEPAPAPSPVDGKCGTSHGQTLAAKPSVNLCSAGADSAVSGTGPWKWSCAGSNGGGAAQCLAEKKAEPAPAPAPVNGKCGSSHGQILTAKPASNLCSAGTASAVNGTGPWKWNCGGTNNGSAAQCLAEKKAEPAPETPVTMPPEGEICSTLQHFENGKCVDNVTDCTIANGIGQKKWNGMFWGSCEAKSCNAGYENWGFSCQKSWSY